jgi:glyoxylase-like metal-dependent hydrolase (beta-lactamase superfamily II)
MTVLHPQIKTSRRALLLASAGVSVASTLARPVRAAPADSWTSTQPVLQSAGWFSLKAAGATIHVISDGTGAQSIDLALAPRETVAEYLKRSLLSPETLESFRNVFLIEMPGRRILVDTGYGAQKGRVYERLLSAGLSPESVTDILITHCHGDHISGLLAGSECAFPKAMAWVSLEDLESFRLKNPKEAVRKATERAFAPYFIRRAVHYFNEGEEIIPGIRAYRHPGHTPGHTFYELTSAGQTVVFAGDVAHMAALQFARPDISVKYDMQPEQAAQERKALFARAADSGVLIAGTHLPFPGIGHVRREAEGYSFLPVPFRDRA